MGKRPAGVRCACGGLFLAVSLLGGCGGTDGNANVPRGSAGSNAAAAGTGGVASVSGGASSGASQGGAGGGTTCGVMTYEEAGYTLTVHGSGEVVNLVLPKSNVDEFWADPAAALSTWTAPVATHFKDDFDFLVFVLYGSKQPEGSGIIGKNVRLVHDEETGVGTPAALVVPGASARLRALVFLGFDYDISRGNILHELGHTWANYITDLVPDPGSHWPVSDIGGQVGAIYERDSIQNVGGNQYTANVKYVGLEYADIELYLMGLLPASEVKPFHLIENYTQISRDSDAQKDTFSADAIRTVSIEDVVARYGPRVPDSTQAPHAFRALPVIVSERPLTGAAWSYLRWQVAAFTGDALPPEHGSFLEGTLFSPPNVRWSGEPTRNFHVATRGVGTMRMDGLVEALRAPSAATCADEPRPAEYACPRLVARAKQCGISESTCQLDTDFDPEAASCIADCAEAQPCTELTKAMVLSNTLNQYILCAQLCQ